ncbi:MAG: hypothetical protein VX916_02820 [Planctomycetota bacterium]|nr:hypothetical protein [Planctomycetota bacterium]
MSWAQDWVGEIPYEPRGSRDETIRYMKEQLLPAAGVWGDWWLLSPFSYAGHDEDDLVRFLPPEEELANLQAGGPGPDLDRVFEGKKGVEVEWQSLGDILNHRVDLSVHEDSELNDYATCYLWGTVSASQNTVVDVTTGSDDGMRFWVNGDLLIDVDVARGLDPESHRLSLSLRAGVNHIFVKVVEGTGGWDFQISSQQEIDPILDTQLQALLERDFPASPDRDHYRVYTYPVPRDIVLEVGGLSILGDGRPVVTTRRGDVFLVNGAYEEPPVAARFETFASGLHEVLGAAVRMEGDTEAVYVTQRGELTRLVDEEGNGGADLYETVCADWGVSGNYHEFAFGPKFDREGNAWITLNVGFCGGLGKSIAPYRGWAVKITPSGEMIPVCDGLRSPNGIGMWGDGEMFYVDNQGDYVATNRLSHLAPGSWHGHPASLRWRDDLEQEDDRPERAEPTVWFPYKKMGQSAADIVLDETEGEFGPFTGQFFVGDQTLCSISRVDLEKIDGHYQGVCFPFIEALDCGVTRLAFAPDGSLIVGQTDRGWTSTGRRRYGLQRIVYRGEPSFDILHMRVQPRGFELVFTLPVDEETATDLGSYSMTSYTYEYHADYGAPENDVQDVSITQAVLVDDRTVRLTFDGLREGYVHELTASGVRHREQQDRGLLHGKAFYTLNHLPDED